MKKPTLVVMAAGMGSRFGGLKQMTPIDPQGNSIIQYSLYDARLAGFEKVVFIIKHEMSTTSARRSAAVSSRILMSPMSFRS